MRNGLLVFSPELFHSLLARVTMAWSAALAVACSGPMPQQSGGLGVFNPRGLEERLETKARIAAVPSTTPSRPTARGRR